MKLKELHVNVYHCDCDCIRGRGKGSVQEDTKTYGFAWSSCAADYTNVPVQFRSVSGCVVGVLSLPPLIQQNGGSGAYSAFLS